LCYVKTTIRFERAKLGMFEHFSYFSLINCVFYINQQGSLTMTGSPGCKLSSSVFLASNWYKALNLCLEPDNLNDEVAEKRITNYK